MSDSKPPFDSEAFTKWLIEGAKETVEYRFRQWMDRDQWKALIRSKIPTRSQVFHQAMKKAFQQEGFVFEALKQGDAKYHVIRKKIKGSGPVEKRLVVVPGFGDTPTSWLTSYTRAKKQIETSFDEILILDFPGYLGFLSRDPMVPSMAALQDLVKLVCDSNPPSTLMGHSLGGWLAGKIAQNLSRPLDHLILIAPSGLTPDVEKDSFGKFITGMQFAPFEELISKLVHQPKRYHLFLKQEFQLFYSKSEVKEFVDSVQPEHFIQPNRTFQTKNLSVIWGEEDQFVPVRWMRYWVESYGPILDAYYLPNTGHLPQLESPFVTAELIEKIIRGEKIAEGGNSKRYRKIMSQRQPILPSTGKHSDGAASSPKQISHKPD